MIIPIDYLVRNNQIDIKTYQSLCPKTTKRTLQRELKILLDMNLLSIKGSTNNRTYTLKLVTNL